MESLSWLVGYFNDIYMTTVHPGNVNRRRKGSLPLYRMSGTYNEVCSAARKLDAPVVVTNITAVFVYAYFTLH